MIFADVCGCIYARVFLKTKYLLIPFLQVASFKFATQLTLMSCIFSFLVAVVRPCIQCAYISLIFILLLDKLWKTNFTFISYHYQTYHLNHAPTHDDILAGVILPAHQQLVHR